MESTYDNNVVYNFLTQRFGKFVSKELTELHFKKRGINDFNSLTSDEQVIVGESIIKESFEEFYNEDKISVLKTLYLLNFSLKNASKKLNQVTKTNCELFINNTDEIQITEVEELLKPVSSKDRITLAFEFTNSFEGVLVVSYKKDKALRLGRLIAKDYMENIKDEKEIEELLVSGISELYNILLPSFSSVIEKIFKTNILYIPIPFAQFKAKYFFNGKFIPIPIMMNSNINIKTSENLYKGDAMLFIKYATPQFENLMNQANIQLDPFEKNPPKIVVLPSDDHMEDMEMLMKLLKLTKENMMDVLKSLGKKDFDKFNNLEIDLFYNRLVDKYLKTASENKKESIKMNIRNLIPIMK